MRSFMILVLALMSLNLKAQDDLILQTLANDYSTVLSDLMVPRLQLGYLENLNGMLDAASRAQQMARFSAIKENLEHLDYQGLELESQYYYQHLHYRLELNIRRLELENRFSELVAGQIEAATGIYHQLLGKEWYQYFLNS